MEKDGNRFFTPHLYAVLFVRCIQLSPSISQWRKMHRFRVNTTKFEFQGGKTEQIEIQLLSTTLSLYCVYGCMRACFVLSSFLYNAPSICLSRIVFHSFPTWCFVSIWNFREYFSKNTISNTHSQNITDDFLHLYCVSCRQKNHPT